MYKIIQDIEKLKKKYTYNTNVYKYVKEINEKEFIRIMKEILKLEKEKVEITDGKYYHDKNNILEIYENGEMKCYYEKVLKYIKYNENEKLVLYNKKENHLNNFTFKKDYERIYKMKKIKVIVDKIEIEFNYIMTDNKVKIFIINVLLYNNNLLENYNKILNIIK
jgi:hypothetical protein